MSRKDTILIAVIVNAGLLAILFASAIIYDTDKLIDHPELDLSLAEMPVIKQDENLSYIASVTPNFDEMDQALKNYVEPTTSVEEEESDFEESVELSSKKPKQNDTVSLKLDYVEVVVRKGDSLDKIARANRVTIESLKKANQLTHERLSIGQILRVPLKNESSKEAIIQPSIPVQSLEVSSLKQNPEPAEVVYHIVKSGDSPWKIARQYGVNYEQILKLNQLNEDKARNLKIGDRIRVK